MMETYTVKKFGYKEILEPISKQLKGMSATTKKVLAQAVIYSGMDSGMEKGMFYRSNTLYAQDCGIDTASLRWSVGMLSRAGMLRVVKKGDRETGATVYQLKHELTALNPLKDSDLEADSEEGSSPIYNNIYFNNSYIHNSELQTQELHTSELHNSELHNSELHNSELHNSYVHTSELQTQELQNPEVHTSDINKKESNSTYMNRKKLNRAETNTSKELDKIANSLFNNETGTTTSEEWEPVIQGSPFTEEDRRNMVPVKGRMKKLLDSRADGSDAYKVLEDLYDDTSKLFGGTLSLDDYLDNVHYYERELDGEQRHYQLKTDVLGLIAKTLDYLIVNDFK